MQMDAHPRTSGPTFLGALAAFASAKSHAFWAGQPGKNSVNSLGDAEAYVARQAWYRKQAMAVAARRQATGRRRLFVDVSLIAKQDARTGIQRVVRGIWAALLERASDFELVPVIATRRHGYTTLPYSDDGRFGTPESDPKPIATREGDVFLGLDLSAHLLPIHSLQVSSWKQAGVSIAIVCYDLLPQTHPQFFTKRTRAHFSRWIDWVLATADTVFCISDDVATQISTRVSAFPRCVPLSIRKLMLGGDLLESVPSVGIRPSDAALLELIQLEPAMLMVGTLEPRKAYSMALDAFDRVWAKGIACHLIIVGKVGWKSRALLAKLRKHPRLGTWLHWVEDASDELLDRLYQTCSGLLVTSHAEGYCLPVVEAAKHGLPILARDIPVLREHVYADQEFFRDQSVGGLASAVGAFLKGNDGGRPRARVPTWGDCTEALLCDLGLKGTPVGDNETHDSEPPLVTGDVVGRAEHDVAINAHGEEKNPYLRADSLSELLDWYDRDFVRCAYVTLLGRQPDRDGENHYVRALRAGRSRLAILRDLRGSQEGRQHDPGIAGLDRALLYAAVERLAGIGWVLRLFSGSIEGNSVRDRQFRVLLNAVMANRSAVQELARTIHRSPVPSTATVPSDDAGKKATPGDGHLARKRVVAPELERLMPAPPLQQYFILGAG